jgi:hypothetical protein
MFRVSFAKGSHHDFTKIFFARAGCLFCDRYGGKLRTGAKSRQRRTRNPLSLLTCRIGENKS